MGQPKEWSYYKMFLFKNINLVKKLIIVLDSILKKPFEIDPQWFCSTVGTDVGTEQGFSM